MSSLLAEIKLSAQTPVLSERLVQKLGPSARHMMDQYSLLLASMADQLVSESGLASGPGLSIYCALDIAEHDEEIAKVFAASTLSYTQIFEREVAPMRVLRRMPVAQVFWSSLGVQAEGSVRAFTSAKACVEQMELDFADGICERALVLNCRMNQIWGQAWAAR